MAKKYKRGSQLTDLYNVIPRVERGEYIYIDARPVRPAAVRHLSLGTIIGMVANGRVYAARELRHQDGTRDAETLP